MDLEQIYESICGQLDQLEIESLRLIIHEAKSRIRHRRMTTRQRAHDEWEASASSDERQLTIRMGVMNHDYFRDFENWYTISDDPVYHLDDLQDWTVKFESLPEGEAASLSRDRAQILIDPRTKTNEEVILLHELIHFHMGDPDEHCGFAAYPSVAQGFSAGLCQRVSPLVSGDLFDVITKVIAKCGVHPISHSTHSVMFLLKSLELDHQTERPPGTIFGYYPEIFAGLSFK